MRIRVAALALAAVAACLAWPVRADDAEPPQKKSRGPFASGVYKDRVTPHWFDGDAKFWYRNSLKGGAKEFILADAEAGTRGPAFDHAKLAAGLSKAAETEYRGSRLPFDDIEFADGSALRRGREAVALRPGELRVHGVRPGAEEGSAAATAAGRRGGDR
jgi:hypothetical protein